MKKRQFLLGFSAASLLANPITNPIAFAANKKPAAPKAPHLLTMTGAISRTNRPAFDPSRDILMGKQKLSFSKAYSFDFSALSKLPSQSIRITLEYDGKPHTLQGPLLADLLQVCGLVGAGPQSIITLRAIDGYAVSFSLAEIQNLRVMIAMQMDGQSMPLGGLGPLWAIYDVEKEPDYASKKLSDRFAKCPWCVYHIDVAA